jgi:4-amino-4-deoxy-L-arabinose transferase-like glycosyltransferase
MNDPVRFTPSDLIWMLLVVGLAAGTRVGYVTNAGMTDAAFAVQGQGSPRSLPGENGPSARTELEELSQNLREERRFACRAPLADQVETTAHVAPGYPWLVSLAARIQDDPGPLIRWVQCGLGALTALFYFFFARRAFDSTLAGAIAGLLAAFYPFWIVNTAELADGVLATFLLAAALALGTRGSQVGGAFTSAAYGLSLAGLTMVRAALLPFAVVGFAWYLARCRETRSGWFAGLLALLGFANGLAPWALRNWQAFSEPLPIVDSAYLHLWMGNNAKANGSTLDEATLRESLSPELLQTLLAETDQPRRYARLGPELLEQVRQDPSAALGHRLDAGACFVLGAHWFSKEHSLAIHQGDADAESPHPRLTESVEPALRGSLLVALLLGGLGWRWSGTWARNGRLGALAMVWLPLPYLLSHAEDLSGPRLPLDGVLLCYTAFAIACCVPGFARRPEQAGKAESTSS